MPTNAVVTTNANTARGRDTQNESAPGVTDPTKSRQTRSSA
jgi:hypothetical protein